MKIFDQKCKTCGGMNLGPREGGKAKGRWLGYDDCSKCREKMAQDLTPAAEKD